MSGAVSGAVLDLDGLDFERGGGLVPGIAQHYLTGEVLMRGYGSRNASTGRSRPVS